MSRIRKRSAGKANLKKERQVSSFFDVPVRQWRNPYPAYEIANSEMLAEVHDASMKILENTGMRFQDEEAMELWEKAGAKVDRKTQHVWIDRGLLMELVAKAPSGFTFRSRNPARSRFIGENAINTFASAGCVFIRDLDRGRRPGERQDFVTLTKMVQMTNAIHLSTLQSVVMHDVAVPEKHLQNFWIGSTMTDKPQMTISHGRAITGDGIEMAKIIHGEDLRPEDGPVTGGVINVNSPLVYDERMLGGMMTFAKHGQFTVVTPFILSGANSPITIIGAIAQQNAEALAGIALLQLVRPGAPCIYGGFATNVDMKSGAPSFGTPEGAWALMLGAQLARFYGVPYRGSGTLNTSNVPDAQAMSESMWSLWPCVLAHTNMIFHAAGWLESGLTHSLEKFVMDVENLSMMQHFLAGPEVGEDAFALKEIHEIGSAGHHFGTEHTKARFSNAFYAPFLHDRRNNGQWAAEGSDDSVTRANKLWKTIVKQYEEPAFDSNTKQALAEYVEKRAKELENVDLYD
ncbi:MAG: trimethylamine--corrinoid protein Co-methyltransferase [Cellvibrionaceae bacterium]|jgi:trimethylamine--corrinoid protein Co-methyltransferase